MNKTQRKQANNFFLFLSALFIAALVVTNLIAQKFIYVPLPFFDFKFEISAGTLAYPLTFLMTDLMSEFFGRKRTNRVVFYGFAASAFVLVTLLVADYFNAMPGSPITDGQFSHVFGAAPLLIFASMLAYLSAQFVDIRLFHFWKKLTKGKHLWLRNNASTILSQLLDTTLVIFVVFWSVEESDLNHKLGLILMGWSFKVLWAALDTPVIYLVAWFVREKFDLEVGEEFSY